MKTGEKREQQAMSSMNTIIQIELRNWSISYDQKTSCSWKEFKLTNPSIRDILAKLIMQIQIQMIPSHSGLAEPFEEAWNHQIKNKKELDMKNETGSNWHGWQMS